MFVQSPLLRYVVYFYGLVNLIKKHNLYFITLKNRNLGVQLRPLNSRLGVLNLLLNLAIYLLFQIVISGSNRYDGSSAVTFITKAKPFLGLVFDLIVVRTFSFSTNISMAYYLHNGGRILGLLDTERLRRPYEARARPYFGLVLLCNTIIFFGSNSGSLYILFYRVSMSHFEIAYNTALLYAAASARYFHFFIAHYLMISTLSNLKQINIKLSTGKLVKSQESLLISQFIELAQLNKQIWWLISLQMTVSYVTAVTHTMVLLYISAFIIFRFRLIFYPLMHILYYIYLINYNLKIRHLAGEIIGKWQQSEREERYRLARRRQLQWRHGPLANGWQECSRLIRRQEIELYGSYFTIYLFNMIPMDRAFLLGTALLALNYAVFLYQT